MDEKVMVADGLSGINGCLTKYGEMISQTENQQLRQTLIKMRNDTETTQYELFQLAKGKGYYEPASAAQPQEIQSVRSLVSQPSAR